MEIASQGMRGRSNHKFPENGPLRKKNSTICLGLVRRIELPSHDLQLFCIQARKSTCWKRLDSQEFSDVSVDGRERLMTVGLSTFTIAATSALESPDHEARATNRNDPSWRPGCLNCVDYHRTGVALRLRVPQKQIPLSPMRED